MSDTKEKSQSGKPVAGRLIVFVIGQAKKEPRGETVQSKPIRSVPSYFGASIPKQSVAKVEKREVAGHPTEIQTKSYQSNILVIEASAELKDIFSEESFEVEEAMREVCDKVLEGYGGNPDWGERYSIWAISGYTGDPEQFFKWKSQIAGFLKSEKLELDEKEITQTLNSQIKYARNDLVIIDWDGAFIFDQEADFASTVELLELANFQLFKYRLLDSELDDRLRKIAKIFSKLPERRRFLFGMPVEGKEIQNALQYIVKMRSTSLFEFEAVDRDIKLIGDWYSARLYELAAKKFKFENWRTNIKEKLETTEDIYEIVSERFSFSPERLELLGWFVLLFGWGIILVFDLWQAFK